jgi:hypothetical protein
VALVLCVAAILGTWAVVQESESTEFRWWLLAFPLGACLAAVLAPVRNVLIGSSVVLAGWCAITGFSVGFFYVPALVAISLAIGRTQ